jgi:hypothetical protein
VEEGSSTASQILRGATARCLLRPAARREMTGSSWSYAVAPNVTAVPHSTQCVLWRRLGRPNSGAVGCECRRQDAFRGNKQPVSGEAAAVPASAYSRQIYTGGRWPVGDLNRRIETPCLPSSQLRSRPLCAAAGAKTTAPRGGRCGLGAWRGWPGERLGAGGGGAVVLN